MKRLERVEALLGVIATLAVLSLGARFSLSAGALWRDEVSTLNVATRPSYREFIASVGLDGAPALYPMVVRAWSAIGFADEDAGLRVLGFLVTAATVGTLWAAARAIGVSVPLLALSLFGVHPAIVPTLGTVKPYGVGVLLVVAAFASMTAVALRTGRATPVVAALLSALAIHTAYQHAATILAVAVAALVLALRRDDGRILPVAMAGALALVSALPYVAILLPSLEWRPLQHLPLPTTQLLGSVLRAAAGGSVVAGAVWVVGGILAAAVAVAEARTARRAAGSPGRFTACYGWLATALAVGGLVLFLKAAGRPPHPWHVAPLIGIAALALDLALVGAPPLRWARCGLALAAAVALLPAAVDAAGPRARQTNVDHIAAFLERNADRRDLVVVTPWYVGITFDRYYRGPAPWTTIPPLEDVTIHRYDLVKRRMEAPAPLAPLHGAIVARLAAGGRVWIVGDLVPFFLPRGPAPPALPPAPDAPSGWSETPYIHAWALETRDVLQRSAMTWRVVLPSEDRMGGSLENAALMVAEGRRRP